MLLDTYEEAPQYRHIALLLRAYEIIDQGVASTIALQQKMAKSTLACTKGCSVCCRAQSDIALFPHELMGIAWFTARKVEEPHRSTLKKRIAGFVAGGDCPFLIGNACSVYPLRPAACRQFCVFGAACEEGEDPYHTRRQDVLFPVAGHIDQAFYTILPFYGIRSEYDRIDAMEAGLVRSKVLNLKDYDWSVLLKAMDEEEE